MATNQVSRYHGGSPEEEEEGGGGDREGGQLFAEGRVRRGFEVMSGSRLSCEWRVKRPEIAPFPGIQNAHLWDSISGRS